MTVAQSSPWPQPVQSTAAGVNGDGELLSLAVAALDVLDESTAVVEEDDVPLAVDPLPSWPRVTTIATPTNAIAAAVAAIAIAGVRERIRPTVDSVPRRG